MTGLALAFGEPGSEIQPPLALVIVRGPQDVRGPGRLPRRRPTPSISVSERLPVLRDRLDSRQHVVSPCGHPLAVVVGDEASALTASSIPCHSQPQPTGTVCSRSPRKTCTSARSTRARSRKSYSSTGTLYVTCNQAQHGQPGPPPGANSLVARRTAVASRLGGCAATMAAAVPTARGTSRRATGCPPGPRYPVKI